MKEKWYRESFRRNLVDMHIEDWSEEFLSEFSPEKYCENLKRAKIKSAMIYFQSHNGLCYYPTKSGKIHNAFVGKEDTMLKLVNLCHENGIDVVGYYSLIFNTYEEEKHPEWRILKTDTQSRHQLGERYGHCCPNNREYVDFVKTQIKEIIDYFPVEGMFYDMTFWVALCRCESCRARWREESGMVDMPTAPDWKSPVWNKYYEARCKWIGDFAKEITDYTKQLAPDVSVEHNYANSIAGKCELCSTEQVNEACDYCGGDIHRDDFYHSYGVKYFNSITKNRPCEYMISRCDNNLLQHTVTKSQARLEKETFINTAHQAATLVIDAIDPCGTVNSEVYQRIGDVFDRQIPYERYLNGELIADVAVLHNTVGKFSDCGGKFSHVECSVEALHTLVREHIPCTVIPPSDKVALDKFKSVVISTADNVGSAWVNKLAEYVSDGGTVYFSGRDERLLDAFFGAKLTGETASTYTYVAPIKEYEDIFENEFSEKYPLPFECNLPTVSMSEEYVAAYIKLPYTLPNERRFASIHSNPPGILTEHPALAVRNFGRGRVIWSCAPIEGDSRYVYRKIFLNLLEKLVSREEYSVLSDAPKSVELVTFEDENEIKLSAVDLFFDEERNSIRSFDVRIKTSACPKRVEKLPSEKPVEFRYSDGYTKFRVEEFELFAMYRILL